jgi:hypothetical protein
VARRASVKRTWVYTTLLHLDYVGRLVQRSTTSADRQFAIRGYEDVKERNIAQYLGASRLQAAKLNLAWPANEAFATTEAALVLAKA